MASPLPAHRPRGVRSAELWLVVEDARAAPGDRAWALGVPEPAGSPRKSGDELRRCSAVAGAPRAESGSHRDPREALGAFGSAFSVFQRV